MPLWAIAAQPMGENKVDEVNTFDILVTYWVNVRAANFFFLRFIFSRWYWRRWSGIYKLFSVENLCARWNHKTFSKCEKAAIHNTHQCNYRRISVQSAPPSQPIPYSHARRPNFIRLKVHRYQRILILIDEHWACMNWLQLNRCDGTWCVLN